MVEGTSLLRKHMGLNLYREFESHRLRQEHVVFYNRGNYGSEKSIDT